VLLVLAACGGDDGPPLSDATSLTCPAAGALPFRLPDDGFAIANNATIATDNPRNKDEASDTIGNPGGPYASVYLADSAAVGTALDYQGAKARTTPTGGLFAKPLGGEKVSLWFYDATAKAWQAKGSATTGTDGTYDIASAGFIAPNGQPVYAMLEADGTCAEHFNYLYPAGQKVVVADIDGTLTSDDQQIIDQETMASYTPMLMTGGDRLTKAWADKGYPVIYLTARVHNLRGDSRGWLETKGFAPGPLITFNGGSSGADVYKTLWLRRMINDFHWTVVAAYGNADTDITAYANAMIPKTQTFIVGPLAGSMGTQPIANMDYTSHIATYVAAQPAP
jgi:hypothetical protein